MLRGFVSLSPHWKSPAQLEYDSSVTSNTYCPHVSDDLDLGLQDPAAGPQSAESPAEEVLFGRSGLAWLLEHQSLNFEPTLYDLYRQNYDRCTVGSDVSKAIAQGKIIN